MFGSGAAQNAVSWGRKRPSVALARELSFSERFGLLVDQQWNWGETQALGRRLKNAKLRVNACVARRLTTARHAAWTKV